MSSQGTPLPEASFPIPPPLFKLPFTTVRDGIGYLTPPAVGMLTQLWAAIQGSGGLIPSFLIVTFPVAGTVAAGGAVAVNGIGEAFSPDITVVADGLAVVGIATSSGIVGGNVNVQPFGIVTDPTWTWVPGEKVWCGDGGVLSQTVTTTPGNWALSVGTAISASSIAVNIAMLVELT